MDAPSFTDSDNRDTLAPDPDAGDFCPDCKVHVSEPCENTCGCIACRKRDLELAEARPTRGVA